MTLEEIKKWRKEEAKSHGWDDRHKVVSYFDWLIAEVEKAGPVLDAAIKTLNENLHLADGDQCTLFDLREAVEAMEE